MKEKTAKASKELEPVKKEENNLEAVEIIEATSDPIHALALKLLSEKKKQEIVDYAAKYNISYVEGGLVNAVAKFLVDKKPGSVKAGKIW